VSHTGGTVVDSSVLLDVFTGDPEWGDWSQTHLTQAAQRGALILNAVVLAEIAPRFERIEALRSQATRDLVVNRAAYLDRVDGLLFGDNPREGVVRGNAFLHPDLKFRLEFPQGWSIQNSPQQVVAQPQGGGGSVFAKLVRLRGRGWRGVAATDLGTRGLRSGAGGETGINGLPAFVGTFQGQMQQMGDVVLRAAWIRLDDRVFRLAGLAPSSAYRQLQPAVDASVRSFQPLSAGDVERIRPNVLDLYAVRQGDTWESIAAGPGRALVPAATLAIINGYAPQERPEPGDRLKIVVEQR